MGKVHQIFQIGLSVCLAGIAMPLAVGSASRSQTAQPFVSTCGTDNEIALQERNAIDQVALEFVKNVLGPNPGSAYSTFTTDAKANVSQDRFIAVLKQAVLPMAPFKDLHVAHRYLAKVTGGTENQAVICGSLSSPQTWVSVIAKPGPVQAYAILEAETLNNTWGFVMWLLPEQGNWHVQYFQPVPTAMVGKTAGDLQLMAISEKQKDHNFNSYVLLATAMQLAERGPFLQLGIRQEILESAGNLQAPPDLEGQPPFRWHLGKTAFKVLNVGAIGVGQKVYLQIDHEIDPWTNDQEADKANHDLISAFSLAHPEYKSAFSGLVVRAHEHGSARGFGTVLANDAEDKK